jgi:hypothetical protein
MSLADIGNAYLNADCCGKIWTTTAGPEFGSNQGLRYKLRMMGIPLDGPANVFCDNEAVVTNTTSPESRLKRKHVAICYHRVREAHAMGMVRFAMEHMSTSLADVLTKCLPGPRKMISIKRILS